MSAPRDPRGPGGPSDPVGVTDATDARIRAALRAERAVPSPALEQALFGAAEDLMALRRERTDDRAQAARRRQRRLSDLWHAVSLRSLAAVAAGPAAPAYALLVLACTAVLVMTRPSPRQLTFADLPELPRGNPVPAQYDAQRISEQTNYEREVENAHLSTSGEG